MNGFLSVCVGCAAVMLLLPPLCSIGYGQETQAPDTMSHFVLDAVVVTADRMETRLANSTSSVSVIQSTDIDRLPLAKFSDVFTVIPGFTTAQLDGVGRNSVINARGFYGGGEAEYNVVLLDGMQINDLETGLVNWNLVPLHAVESVEISRGTSSPLYGDAALGSVINVITRRNTGQITTLTLESGSFSHLNGGLHTSGNFGPNSYQGFVSHERTKGFRGNSTWRATNGGGGVLFSLDDISAFRLSTMNQWTRSDDAGPLTVRELQANRTGSSVYYKNDKKNEDRHYGSAEYSRDLSAISTLNAGVFYRNKSANSVRTFTNPSVILDPSTFAVIGLYDTTLYGDTKERELSTNQIGLNLQFNHAGRLGNMPNRLVAGLEGEYGHLTNKYYNSFTGFEGDYTQGVASRGTVIRDGKNSRLKLAAYASNEFHPFDPLTVSLGARFDAIRDRYDGALPDSSLEADNSAFSPKVGLNIRYLDSPDWAGNMYAAVNRSFKAATLDQLSDQRPIDAGSFLPLDTTYTSFMFLPVSVPPFSNASLKPQRGTSYEAGIYQRFKHLKGSHGELTLSVYQIDLKDEIDFDVATLKYQNIVHSRHRGVEAGLRLYWLPNLMTFFNHTWTSPTFRSGGYSGKFMKSIPRNITGLGLTYELASGLRTGLTWNFVGRIYLDDDNTMSLPDYSTGGFRLSYSISPVTVLLDIENLLDRKYSSTGYVLSGTTYLYPSAGRSFRGGIRVQLQ